MAETIRVKSNMPDKSQVAIWERNPEHPKSEKFPDGGEIFIADDKEHEVAPTSDVNRAIKDGKLVKVEAGFVETAQRGAEAVAESAKEVVAQVRGKRGNEQASQ